MEKDWVHRADAFNAARERERLAEAAWLALVTADKTDATPFDRIARGAYTAADAFLAERERQRGAKP